MRANDLVGQRFGRLTAVSKAGTNKYRYTLWLCRCDCGNEHVVSSNALRYGSTQSCGCLQTEARERNGRMVKHGHKRAGKRSPTYSSWAAMRDRCLNPSATGYERYGGCGLTICARWESFENFLEDMGERPAGKSIDRIDPYGNYEPENCRWATPKEQAANRRLTSAWRVEARAA
jgi:hypothetical protein